MTKKTREPKEPKLEIPKTEVEIAQAQFTDLQNHPAWIRLVQYYDKKLVFLRQQLESKDLADLSELRAIRDKIFLTEQFRNLPEIILAFTILKEGQNIEFDPYEK